MTGLQDRQGIQFSSKQVGIIGATPGGMGTAYAQMQLRQVLDAMKAYVLPFQKVPISQVHEKVDVKQLALTYEKTRQYLQRYIQHLLFKRIHTIA